MYDTIELAVEEEARRRNSEVINFVLGEWRIYTVKELRTKSIGTLFYHPQLGQGKVSCSYQTVKHMAFSTGEIAYFVQDDIEPWDEPMKEITL